MEISKGSEIKFLKGKRDRRAAVCQLFRIPFTNEATELCLQSSAPTFILGVRLKVDYRDVDLKVAYRQAVIAVFGWLIDYR